jgi:hypothetical protein
MRIKVKLTLAQLQFFRNVIHDGESMGDCERKGCTLRFNDYEGAQAVLNRMVFVRTKTTREYVTWNSVVDRINAAIRAAAGAQKRTGASL